MTDTLVPRHHRPTAVELPRKQLRKKIAGRAQINSCKQRGSACLCNYPGRTSKAHGRTTCDFRSRARCQILSRQHTLKKDSLHLAPDGRDGVRGGVIIDNEMGFFHAEKQGALVVESKPGQKYSYVIGYEGNDIDT